MDVDGKMQMITIENTFITECDISYYESRTFLVTLRIKAKK